MAIERERLSKYIERSRGGVRLSDRYLNGTPRARTMNVGTARTQEEIEREEIELAERQQYLMQLDRVLRVRQEAAGDAVRQQIAAAQEAEEQDVGALQKHGETVLDMVGNILAGVGKHIEGGWDFALNLVGGIGGLFSDEFEENVKDWVNYDIAWNWIGKHFDSWTQNSYTENGGIAESVGYGIGYILPSVIVSIVSHGAAAPVFFSQFAPAAGVATEEASQEGADSWEALGYGTVMGGVEFATNKLVGGAAKLGGGYLDDVLRSTGKAAPTGLRRVAGSMVGEAFEEGLSELAAPSAKTIYKGRDALDEYGEGEFWQGVGQAAIVGGLTDATWGGTVGRVMHTSGKYDDVRETVDDIRATEAKRQRLHIDGKLTDAREDAMHRRVVADYRQIEKILQRANPKQRARMMAQNGLDGAFDADGSLTADFLRSLGENVVDGQTDTQGENEAQDASVGTTEQAKHDHRYMSPDLWRKTAEVNSDLQAISERIGTQTKVFSGELSDAAKKNYTKTKKALTTLNDMGGNEVSLVITEANGDYKGGLVGDRTIYMPADQLESGDWAGTLVHEFTHFEEGTVEYSEMMDFLNSDDILVDNGKGGKAILRDVAEKVLQSKGYDMNIEAMREILKKADAGEALAVHEAEALKLYVSEMMAHETEIMLGNEAFIAHIVRQNGSAVERIVSKILSLDRVFSKFGDKQSQEQKNKLREAERLYLKAATAAGNARIRRLILSQVSELEDEEKVQMSFAGVNAKTADRALLSQAQERIANGEDGETVRRDTGWFKGYDGKWRFEIDDSEIEIAFNGKYSRDPDIRRYAELVEKVYFLDSATEQEQQELVALDKKLEGKEITPNKLGDMIKHPTLFESYPQLAELDIYLHDGNTDQASYHPGFKEIAVPKRLKMDAKKFKKTLLHEIQHAVQDIEGFASGSNPDMFNNTGERSAYEQYQSTAGEIEARDTANRADLSEEQRKNTRPDIDREDVVFAEGGVFYAANSKRAQEDAIRTQIRDHLDEINQMAPVAEVTFDASKITDNIIAKKLAVEEFKKIGGQVDRQNFGIILIGKDEIGTGIGYVHTPAERAALFTVPKVLKRGKIIYEKENHKENGFPTVTIAAPVIINGKRAVVGAVVQKTGKNKYHAHRILLPDGSVFVLNKTDAELSTASMLSNETQQRLPNNSASINSIAQNSEKSTENAKKVSDSKTVQLSLKEDANQQTPDDFSDLLASAGIEGEALEIRENLVALSRMAADENADEVQIKRFAKSLAMSMAREGRMHDGETRAEATERLHKELLVHFDIEKAAKDSTDAKQQTTDEPKPKKTGYTYDDVNTMLDDIRKGSLSFETASGVIDGKIFRNDRWELGKRIYNALKMDELGSKRELSRKIASLIVDAAKINEKGADGKTVQRRLADVLGKDGVADAKEAVAIDVAAALGDRDAKKYNKRMNDLKYAAQQLSDMKKGKYVNAANYKGDTFKVALSELARMNWRGGLVSAKKLREHFAALSRWYTPSNPLYGNGGEANENYRRSIAEALDFVSDTSRGAFTLEDIDAAEMIVKYFKREIENYGTIFKSGKRVDAEPIAKVYATKIDIAKEITERSGIMQGIMRNRLARLASDPALLMREADGHVEGGFFSEQFEEMRHGTIQSAVLERELTVKFVEFWEKNHAYAKRYNNAQIQYGDKSIPLQEAISLYMTMKREHAFAGLAYAGFEIETDKGTVNVSDGFSEAVEKVKVALMNEVPPEKALTMTQAEIDKVHDEAISKAVAQMREELYRQFTAEDKRLISIMERGYEDGREVKIKNDIVIYGESNVIDGYYYPIRRAGLAESLDVMSMFEGDRVSNLSFNKDTVKNAHKLLIEPAHIVFMRHIKAMSLYDGLGIFTDNFNRLYNLNIGESANNPITLRTKIAQAGEFPKEMMAYFKELKQDVEGITKKRGSEKFYNDAVAMIRSAYATYQIGANPKTWASQFSSLIASTVILDPGNLARGFAVSGKDVDNYCKLAWLRDNDGAAVLAQSVTTGLSPVQMASRNALQKVRDVSMWPIGKVDRWVIKRAFAACQVQVEKKKRLKLGTEENKIEAGKLLESVILETQQNSLATERTAAMRSGDELLKGFNMFIADAMKVGARALEPLGKLASLRTQRRIAAQRGDTAEVARLDKKIKASQKECVRATSVLVAVSIYNALLAYGFKWFYRRDEDEDVGTVAADAVGNMIGGIPFVRDVYTFFKDGFEAENFAISTINNVLQTTSDTTQLLYDAIDGKDISRQEALRGVQKVLYSAGQLAGVPTRNLYNNVSGIINHVSPETGYMIEGGIYKKNYSTDLAKAIEADDERMISLIASMMIEDSVGEVDKRLASGLRELVEKGYRVLPSAVGDTITYDGEVIKLTKRQRQRFKKVYGIAEEQILSMMSLRQYREASDEVRARAIKMIWDAYYDLAVDDVLGVDSAEKNVLFAEAIDMDKLALIVASAKEIKADVDASGKAINGSRLAKIEKFVAKLNLHAAQKYMVMGYLGYKNTQGEDMVRSYISRISALSAEEKKALMVYSGYASAA